MILDTVATGKENDDFFLQVLLEECEKKQEAAIRRADNVSLRKGGNSARRFFLVDIDVNGSWAKRNASKVGNFGGLSRREKHGLAFIYTWLQ